MVLVRSRTSGPKIVCLPSGRTLIMRKNNQVSSQEYEWLISQGIIPGQTLTPEPEPQLEQEPIIPPIRPRKTKNQQPEEESE